MDTHTVRAGAHFVAITDPARRSRKLATEAGFRRTFLNDPRIGGRFSALSFFGWCRPRSSASISIGSSTRAAAMAARCGPDVAIHENPGCVWAPRWPVSRRPAAQGHPARLAGRSRARRLARAAVDGVHGKLGRGLVVINEEPVGPPNEYATTVCSSR